MDGQLCGWGMEICKDVGMELCMDGQLCGLEMEICAERGTNTNKWSAVLVNDCVDKGLDSCLNLFRTIHVLIVNTETDSEVINHPIVRLVIKNFKFLFVCFFVLYL